MTAKDCLFSQPKQMLKEYRKLTGRRQARKYFSFTEIASGRFDEEITMTRARQRLVFTLSVQPNIRSDPTNSSRRFTHLSEYRFTRLLVFGLHGCGCQDGSSKREKQVHHGVILLSANLSSIQHLHRTSLMGETNQTSPKQNKIHSSTKHRNRQ